MNGEINDQKDARQHHDLKSNRAFFRIKELWEQGKVKQRHFWIQNIREETLSEDHEQ